MAGRHARTTRPRGAGQLRLVRAWGSASRVGWPVFVVGDEMPVGLVILGSVLGLVILGGWFLWRAHLMIVWNSQEDEDDLRMSQEWLAKHRYESDKKQEVQ